MLASNWTQASKEVSSLCVLMAVENVKLNVVKETIQLTDRCLSCTGLSNEQYRLFVLEAFSNKRKHSLNALSPDNLELVWALQLLVEVLKEIRVFAVVNALNINLDFEMLLDCLLYNTVSCDWCYDMLHTCIRARSSLFLSLSASSMYPVSASSWCDDGCRCAHRNRSLSYQQLASKFQRNFACNSLQTYLNVMNPCFPAKTCVLCRLRWRSFMICTS